MQLLLIRHALPLRSEPGQGSDPDLAPEGIDQAKRLPDALARFPITRLISSPQKRAVQTAEPVAAARGLEIEIDDRFAEYDRDLTHYIPIEQIAAEYPEEMARLASGHLPSSVDESAFLERINAGVRDLVESTEHEATVAVFTHGGVINGLVHTIMRTEKVLCVNVDYAGVTRLLSSRTGNLYVASVNGTEHVWDLLPRNQRW
ncbi:histidine phosphatase super family protein [Mycolicibacterium hassiacum DSM 44199]|uniref:Histidine phosphatase super family protein n=1 Tax=Mycolicibacterium hassiacum (strain DSM 44199 / CIP 105218 / JCM 12690 / 3849) TaxID=1122247 RepID=K5BD98_MYCHD|nr:histidine phosphatase family protein [Mycolicibacterium hassiacum]EKF21326.1 histidine phosphatase super family protein [Mycolicibacterium hassiacum DSM 44199]MBX5488997.1 histidine phosphatase family protein [Mycolicibacterium hassiacum]MDA4085324.1 phosphoglycerate kinase [Mycolicibacterium hassiacum DSM 44199]VCT92806.1 Phosphoserine phosphatase 1 [Mycolicibacterium hassiacum DSM 44199]